MSDHTDVNPPAGADADGDGADTATDLGTRPGSHAVDQDFTPDGRPLPPRRDEDLVSPASAEEVSGEASLWSEGWRVLRRNPMFWISAFIILAMVVMAVFPQLYLSFYGGDPNADGVCSLSNSVNNPGAPNGGRPSSTNWFGFDIQGCDVYTETITGARISIFIGLIVTTFAVIIALLFGTLSGYYGKTIDTFITRITDIWFAVPTILGGIVLLSVMGERGLWQVAFVLTVFGWPSMLRLMRSQVIAVKEQDFVMASRSLGASNMRLMVRHILPNGITPVIVYATIFIGSIITAEAALSFLGVGIALPAVSWGLMISEAQSRILQAPHLLFFPGAALAITVFGFLVMGDALRDAFDPKGR